MGMLCRRCCAVHIKRHMLISRISHFPMKGVSLDNAQEKCVILLESRPTATAVSQPCSGKLVTPKNKAPQSQTISMQNS